MTIHIVSYNLLVCIYADDPTYYHKCQPQFLKTPYRWQLIENELEREISLHENTVICLQEVCRTLLPKLESFFNRQNYTFYYNLYGQAHNDYMGVGIAIPNTMHLNSYSFVEIKNYLRSLSQHNQGKKSCCSWIWNLCQPSNTNFRDLTDDPWAIAMSRNNTLVCLEVVVNGKVVFIGTYHMPCLYNMPDVMMIHASAVKDLMFEKAAGQSVILAGDFNIDPLSDCYQALTRSDSADINLSRSKIYKVPSHSISNQKLKSAYYEKNGTEPTYTNFADTSRGSIYCNTLDYIFFTGKLRVENVLQLPDRPTGSSYPDETHPSDHLMIAATFRLL